MVLTKRSLAFSVALAVSSASLVSGQVPKTIDSVQAVGLRRLLFGFALECVNCERMPRRGGGGGGRLG